MLDRCPRQRLEACKSRAIWSAVACYRLGLAKLASPSSPLRPGLHEAEWGSERNLAPGREKKPVFEDWGLATMGSRGSELPLQGASKLAHSKDASSHSYLNARTGFSFAARRAGIQQASSPAVASVIATSANVIGSRGENLNNRRAIN